MLYCYHLIVDCFLKNDHKILWFKFWKLKMHYKEYIEILINLFKSINYKT